MTLKTVVRTSPVVDLREVSFRRGDRRILTDVSFTIFTGELCALVGPNGSGKTTLVRILLGLLKAESGEVDWHPNEQHVTIGYVPQRVRIEAELLATVDEVVGTGLLGRKSSRAERKVLVAGALKQVGLDTQAKTRMSELSGGQQQRALIARALVREPDLLVLDEPVAGVDTDAQRAFHDVLELERRKGTAILLVSHELSAVADLVDRVVVLRNQSVEFNGPPTELSARGISLGIHDHDLPVWLERS